MPLLVVEDLHTYYGEAHILQGVSLRLEDGEAVTLIGRNGAGKTTTLRSIMGIARAARTRGRGARGARSRGAAAGGRPPPAAARGEPPGDRVDSRGAPHPAESQ